MTNRERELLRAIEAQEDARRMAIMSVGYRCIIANMLRHKPVGTKRCNEFSERAAYYHRKQAEIMIRLLG